MANLENIKDMYDVAMKPRMLRTLMKEDLPNEKRPFTSMLALSRIVSTVKTHDLLSESESQSLPDSKHIQRWKSAVDDWADRLLTLVSNSSMPDKCWAGICLLGVTCQQCSADRFLASYAVWLDKLLVHAQVQIS
uniref:Uncharacterized protein MANES_11G110200 n=1 Tax=Rhizophora mucronata TaxID=61149 RepID=A0A2P2LE54_RHIMU